MRNLIVFILTFFCLVLDASAASYKSMQLKCRKIAEENPAQVKIIYNYGKLQYNTELNQEELGKVHASQTGKYEDNLKGLTSLQPSILVDGITLNYQVLTDDYICLYPDVLRVKINYQPIIYILNSIPKDTCMYDLTLRHEYTHLDIGYAALNLFVLTLRNKIPDIATSSGIRVITADEMETAPEEMNTTYQTQVLLLWDMFMYALDEQHAKLDVPETYVREKNICKSMR